MAPSPAEADHGRRRQAVSRRATEGPRSRGDQQEPGDEQQGDWTRHERERMDGPLRRGWSAPYGSHRRRREREHLGGLLAAAIHGPVRGRASTSLRQRAGDPVHGAIAELDVAQPGRELWQELIAPPRRDEPRQILDGGKLCVGESDRRHAAEFHGGYSPDIRDLASLSKTLARNRKSCTGVAATKGASRQGGMLSRPARGDQNKNGSAASGHETKWQGERE